jgi:predicted DNA-binding transcriptional regulator AlpA
MYDEFATTHQNEEHNQYSIIYPDDCLLSLEDIIGKRGGKIKALIPVSKSSFFQGVATGRYPKPLKLGRRSFWRYSEIRTLIQSLGCPE